MAPGPHWARTGSVLPRPFHPPWPPPPGTELLGPASSCLGFRASRAYFPNSVDVESLLCWQSSRLCQKTTMLSHQVYFMGCRVLQSSLAKWNLGILQRVPQSYHLWKWKILEVIIGNEVSVQLDSGQFRQAASLFLAPVSSCLYGSRWKV